MLSDLFLPLGVQADTGALLPPIDSDSLDAFSTQPVESEVPMNSIEAKCNGISFGTDFDVLDPNDLSEAGWAVLFSPGTSDTVKKQLQPLIEHRRQQVGDDRRFKIFEGADSFAPGDTAESWLARKGIAMQDVDPPKGVPFYVMLVGSPQEIPFEFQYGLDLFWAVGRLWFPTPAEYGRYSESVVEYESAASVATSRQMAIFAPRNGEDRAMGLLTENLAFPMTVPSETKPPFGKKQKFRLQPFFGESASKEALDNIWRGRIGNGPPSVVFTGSHGMVFFAGDRRQAAQQGAIVCNEWAGVDPPKRNQFYAAGDLPDDAKMHGMVHLIFDCYGAGCPRNDNFSGLSKWPARIAEAPLLARLPQALLAHKNGGALAVLGHVDRAWSSSYRSPTLGAQIEGFRGVVSQLMSGHRIGYATDRFNQRWSTLSIELAEELGRKTNDDVLKAKWIARNDARNYIVIGDPAVRLRVEDIAELRA